MGAPKLAVELLWLHLIAAWAAQTAASLVLHAAWCAADLVLQAQKRKHRGFSTSSALTLDVKAASTKPSKLDPCWSPHAFLFSLQHAMCILQQQGIPLPDIQQLLAADAGKAGPAYQGWVSTPKPLAPNCWLPSSLSSPAGDTAESGPATAPSESSTQATGSSAAAGQGSSSASASSSIYGSHHSSGQNSIGAGGQDDSDEDGGDKKRQAYQMVKSHSLETPEPLLSGSSTANIIQAAVDRAGGGTTATSSSAAAGAAATQRQQLPAAPGAAAAVAARSTPFQAAPRPMMSPFALHATQAATAQQLSTPNTSSSNTAPAAKAEAPQVRLASPFAAAAAAQIRSQSPAPPPPSTGTAAAAAGTTGPWKPASPFAAAAGAVGGDSSSSAAATSTSGLCTWPQPSAAIQAATGPAAAATPAPAVPPNRIPSPFAAVASPSASPFAAAASTFDSNSSSRSSASSSAGSSGSSRSRRAAAAAAAAARAAKAGSSTAGSMRQGQATAATGPWRLHSPFAAAPLPAFSATSTQLDAVAEGTAEGESSSPDGSTAHAAAPAPPAARGTMAQLHPTQQAVNALAAAAAGSGGAGAGRRRSPLSYTPSNLSSSSHSSYSSRGSRPPTPSAAQAVAAARGAAGAAAGQRPVQNIPQQPPAATAVNAVGPGGLRSPFAAAAAVAAATDAAFSPKASPRVSPTGNTTSSTTPKAQQQQMGPAQQAVARASVSSSSSARQGADIAHSISLNTLMYPSAFSSSVLTGSSGTAGISGPGGSSGTISINTTATKSGSQDSAGADQGSTTGPAAVAATVPSAAVQGISPSSSQQQLQSRRAGPSKRPSQQQLLQQQQQPTMLSPFAAAAAASPAQQVASTAAVMSPAARPAPVKVAPRASAAAVSPSSRPATAAGAAARPALQPVGFRPAVMPIGVSAAQAALMPPVLMALPPTQQQLMAAAQYQASSPTGVLTRPGGSLLGTAAAAAQGNPVLVPQFVLPTSAGLFGALPAAAGTGVLLPLSVGMLAPPAVLMQPPGLSASSRAARGTPAAFGVMPAAAAAPGRLPAQQRPAAGAAAAAAGAVTQLPGSMVGVSAGGAVGAAVPRLSCMCVAPACLTEGQATQAQVYVVGLEGTKIEGATPGSGQVYRVAAFLGSTLVADGRRECRGGERLFRVSLPALPKGVLQIIVVDGANRPCFMQHMLVLPAPAAQEMNTLWSQLLRGQLSTAPAPAAATAPAVTSTAAPAAAGSSEVPPASRSSSMQSSSSMPDAAAGQAKRVGPQEIQGMWQDTFYRIVTDIAALLLARKPAGAQAAAESPAAAGGPQVSMDTPESRRKMSSLTHFLAANGKWAVLELLTDHVFGSGSSARAMYAARTLAGTAAAAALPVLPSTAPVAAPAGPDSADTGSGPTAARAAGAAGSGQSRTSEIQPAEVQSPASVNSSADSKQPLSGQMPTAAPAAGTRDGSVTEGAAPAVRSTAAKAVIDRSLLARLRLKFKAALKDK